MRLSIFSPTPTHLLLWNLLVWNQLSLTTIYPFIFDWFVQKESNIFWVKQFGVVCGDFLVKTPSFSQIKAEKHNHSPREARKENLTHARHGNSALREGETNEFTKPGIPRPISCEYPEQGKRCYNPTPPSQPDHWTRAKNISPSPPTLRQSKHIRSAWMNVRKDI